MLSPIPEESTELLGQKSSKPSTKRLLVAGVGGHELASVEVVAGPREHDVKRVYATAIVVLLMF